MALSCPVCKEHLDETESLHDHLNTHPKKEVIKALIRLKVACKDNREIHPSGSEQGNGSNNPDNETGTDSTQGDFEKIFAPSSPSSQSEQEHEEEKCAEEESISSAEQYILPSSVPSPAPSQMVPLPQFLAGATPVAQFIQVPVVTSAVSSSVQPSSTQTSMLLYSPFVCPPASSQPTVSPANPMDQTQLLHFITNSNLIRPPYSIIQTRPNSGSAPSAPLAAPQSISEAGREGSSSHIIFMPANPVAPQTSAAASGDPEEAREDETEDVYERPKEEASKSVVVIQEALNGIDLQKEKGEPSVQEGLVSQEEDDCEPEEHEPPDEYIISDYVEEAPNRQDLTEPEVLSPPKKRRSPEWSSPGSPGAHSNCSSEGLVRVRSDLNCSDGSTPVPAPEEKTSIDWPIVPIVQLKVEVDTSADTSAEFYPASASSVSNFSNVAYESVISDPVSLKTRKNEGTNCDSSEKSSQTGSDHHIQKSVNAANCHSKVNEGLRILIPNVNSPSSKVDDFRDDCSMGRPGTPPYDSGPPSPYQKSLDSPSTPLNIQTDETMPPRGELSEQESIGGNSSSMWSVPAYHMSREWPSPVVSYDLTARESWPGSDVSDSEGNGTDTPQPQCFKAAPSFTNTLQPFLPKPSSETTFHGESSFSPHIHPQNFVETLEVHKNTNAIAVGGKGPSKKSPENNTMSKAKKTPAKPRVFRCKECSSAFSSLKLRRQHPCDLIKNSSNTTITVMRMDTAHKNINDENISVPGSSSEDLGVQSKPKKKYTRKPKASIKKEVIVEDQSSGQASFGGQYRINKLEPEDTAESRTNSQTSLDVPAPQPCQTAYDLVNTNMAFEEEPVKDESLKPAVVVLECNKCNDVFQTTKQICDHMLTKHKGQKYQCTTCGESFENERSYYDHLMVHPLECQLCGKTFKRRKYLNLHMKWHMETKPHKCDTCGKSFVTKQKLDEHLNTHTGNAPIKCSDCDKTFKRYSNLIQHRNRHHLNLKPKTKDYVCHCGEVLPSKKKLEWHKEIHDDKPKSCHYCSEKFLHTVSLTRHIRRTHNESYVPKKERENENIECPVCRVVILKSSLATHMKIHSGERTFPCHICGKDFSTKWNLQLHRWTHASRSARPFKCTLCKASFVRKQDYFGHMHSHRNVRPYTCNHCGCQFVRKYNCYRHMREHEANKKFNCTICNKSFHRRYYLNDHMRVHNGARPFTCHICGKASTSKSNHNKHVKIHHAREPQNTEI